MKPGKEENVNAFKFDATADSNAALRTRDGYRSFRQKELSRLVSDLLAEEQWSTYRSAFGGMTLSEVSSAEEDSSVVDREESDVHAEGPRFVGLGIAPRKAGNSGLSSLTIALDRAYVVIWRSLFPQSFAGALRGAEFDHAPAERLPVASNDIDNLDVPTTQNFGKETDPTFMELFTSLSSCAFLIGPPFIAAPTSSSDPGAWQVEVRRRPGVEVTERPDFEITVDGEVPQDAELSWLQPADGPEYAVYATNGPAPVSVELTEREDGAIAIDFHTS